jgi:hypothetical protein
MHEIIVEFLTHIDARLMRKLGSSSCDLILNALCLIGFGMDLLGALQIEQSREFLLRAEVQSPAEILRSATVTNAHLLGKQDEIGTISQEHWRI